MAKRSFNTPSLEAAKSKLSSLQSRLGDITSAQSQGYTGDSEAGAGRYMRSLSSSSSDAYSGGGDTQSSGDMMEQFGSIFAPQQETIMSSYDKARQATADASKAQRGLIESEYGGKREDAIAEGERGLMQTKEQDIGYARSPIMLSLMASESDKRIRGLQKDKQELLMANDYERASALSKLIVDEQKAITDARVTMLNEYFGFRNEARADTAEKRASLGFNSSEKRANEEADRQRLGFRTPEQTAVIDLAGKFPDSGITESDNLATAQEKVRNSPAYRQDIRAGEASIEASYASAASSRASAAKSLSEMSSASSTARGEVSAVLDSVSVIDQILSPDNADALENVFGAGHQVTGLTPGKTQLVNNQVDQIKAVLSLDNRQKLKGQGAISDFEAKILAQAATALDKNLSKKDAEKELKRIRGVFQTAAGLEATVKVVNPKTKEQISVLASRDEIDALIAEGNMVEYQ